MKKQCCLQCDKNCEQMTTKNIFKQKIKKETGCQKINNTEAISRKPGFCKFHLKGKIRHITNDWNMSNSFHITEKVTESF
jgi:hypothetical protein